MVGDGVNDVFVLVKVDIGIVIGIGIEVVIEVVDIIIFGGDLMFIFKVIYVSKVIICNIC